MDQQIQLLLQRLDDLSGEFRELQEGVQKAVQLAELDPEMALTRVRKILEYIIRDVYVRRCEREPKSQPLENLLQQLVKDGHLPSRIDAYANTIRKLGNVGTHEFGKKLGEEVTMDDVQSSLNHLLPILLWYFEVERPEAIRIKTPDVPLEKNPPEKLVENENPLADIRRRMLVSNSIWQLRECSYEVDNFLSNNPHHAEALMMKDQIKQAVYREEVMSKPVNSMMPSPPLADASPMSMPNSKSSGGLVLVKILIGVGLLLIILYFLFKRLF